MKSKLIFLYVFVCVFSFGFATIGASNDVDSTSLDNPVKLATSITKAKIGGTPVGTVITWAHAGMPEDAENWLECDGKPVSETKHPELYKLMHTTPDYRGKFLRSAGGKAANLGEAQKSSVYLEPNEATVKMGGTLVVAGGATTTQHGDNDGGKRATYSSSGNYVVSTGRYSSYSYGNTPYSYVNNGSTINLPIRIESKDNETRPDNVTVRYLIRAAN